MQDQVLEPQRSDPEAREMGFDMLLQRLGKEAYEQRGVLEIQRETQDNNDISIGTSDEVFAIALHRSQSQHMRVTEHYQNGGDKILTGNRKEPNGDNQPGSRESNPACDAGYRT